MRRATFLAARAPRARVAVGMVVTVPAAEVRTRPPAVVKAAVEMGSRKTIGCATVMLNRQTAKVIANKPWGGKIQIKLRTGWLLLDVGCWNRIL